MKPYSLSILLLTVLTKSLLATSYEYLDPTKLQTKTSPKIQRDAADRIIRKYTNNVKVEVDPSLFTEKKDVFKLNTKDGKLHIRASTGVAAVWSFNYYLKKYCKSHIGWQVKHVVIPSPLPEVDEEVVANDRFRYYQNVCTVSYSFVWWNVDNWLSHVEWMALNGINLVLAPVAQEAAWARVYRRIGMTEEEIDKHFTGPAFLSWLRMGNVHGWGGPLFKSWHDRQTNIEHAIVDLMFQLGIVPVFPAFSGHVPRAFSRIYPKSKFFSMGNWLRFSKDYCCLLFVNPVDPLFKIIGKMFLKEITSKNTGHIYNADSFNEISIDSWTTDLVTETAKSMFSVMTEVDDKAVWLIQNWLFINNPYWWQKDTVKAYLTSVPIGRLLILDLQAEQSPKFRELDMYFGQPFIWCMLHNFGGNSGMYGITKTISKDVYEARSLANSTMLGIGLTAEGIFQNYVLYDLMLESAWRKGPILDLETWVEDYAQRRYGCNSTANAWRNLLQSVYNFKSNKRLDGQYTIITRPSLKLDTWYWYNETNLFEAFKTFVSIPRDECSSGFEHDLVDITREALVLRAHQLYDRIKTNVNSNVTAFNASINHFLDALTDIEQILATNNDFTAVEWFSQAENMSTDPDERAVYKLNARNQITLWGPNGEIRDYAAKQWAEIFHYYYIPRWTVFLNVALEAKAKNVAFDENKVQEFVFKTVEKPFEHVRIDSLPTKDTRILALAMYKKWETSYAKPKKNDKMKWGICMIWCPLNRFVRNFLMPFFQNPQVSVYS